MDYTEECCRGRQSSVIRYVVATFQKYMHELKKNPKTNIECMYACMHVYVRAWSSLFPIHVRALNEKKIERKRMQTLFAGEENIRCQTKVR